MTAVTAIMALTDVKPRLNIDLADTSHDAELVQFIAEVSDVVEYIVGPVRSAPFTEWHPGMTPQILLLRHPIDTVTSVTEYVGTVSYTLTQQSPDTGGLDGFGFFLYPDEGIVERTAYGMPCWFAALPWWTQRSPGWITAAPQRYGSGIGRVKVVYTAGRSAVPAHILGGALELLRVNYQQTQQTSRGRSAAATVYDEPGQMILGFYVPNRVREMLLPSTQAHGLR